MVKSEASIIVENVHFALATIDRMYEETLSNYDQFASTRVRVNIQS